MSDAVTQAEQRVHELAVEQTGLDDFGGGEYLIGLRTLLAAIESDLGAAVLARPQVHEWLLRPLMARQYAVAGWKKNPGVLDNPIAGPVIIVGVPRTATTALHRLVALNPAFQGIESWLTRAPMTRPPRQEWNNLPVYRAAVAAHERRAAANPGLADTHLTAPDEVDECLPVMAQTFVCNAFGSRISVPGYDAWWRNQDETPPCRWLADSMRLIGANDPDRRWLLKNPSHILEIETLCRVFPDARIIHIHRDPLRSIPSICNLLSVGREKMEGRPIDRGFIARREIDLWRRGVANMMRFTGRNPGRVLDIAQEELGKEPITVSRRIHDFVGMPFDDATERASLAWAEEQKQKRRGSGAEFDLAELALTPGMITGAFSEYRAWRGFAS